MAHRYRQPAEPEMSESTTVPVLKPALKTEKPKLYKVLLFNDDYTPREFVVRVLKAEFRLSEDQAMRVMITAHRKGLCVVMVYPKDVAETKAARAMDMAASQGFPLRFSAEPEE